MTAWFSLEKTTASSDIGNPSHKGEVTAEDVLNSLHNLEWATEAARMVWAKKSSPGLAVTNHANGSKLWVQGVNWLAMNWPGLTAPNDFGLIFIVGIFDAPDPPSLYSLAHQRELHECQFSSYDQETIERLFSLYLAEDHDVFFHELFQLQVVNIIEWNDDPA